MADISFECPSCRQHLAAPPEMADEVIACPSCQKNISVPKPVQQQFVERKLRPPAMPRVPPAFTPRQSVPQSEIQTNVKQGALIGGFVCFALGILFMYLSLLSFLLYVPFFFVAFVLSIVAMAQRRVFGGVGLLLLTLIGPYIFFWIVLQTRAERVKEMQATTQKETASTSRMPQIQRQATTQNKPSTPISSEIEVPSNKAVPAQETDVPQAPTYQALDEKNGFRSFVLGTPFSKFDALSLEAEDTYINSKDEKWLSVKNIDTKLGNAEISRVLLIFSQGLLKEIVVNASGKQNELGLREALIAAYGQPVLKRSFSGEDLIWDGTHTTLRLHDNSTATFENKDVLKKIDDIIKAKAKAGAKEGARQL